MLDLRNLGILFMLVSISNGLSLTLCYFVAARYAGLLLWAIGGAANALGWFLLLLRGSIPDLFSIVLANTLLVLATALLHQGLVHFLGLRNGWQQRALYIALPVTVAGLILFTYLLPNIAARIVLMSVLIAFFSGIAAWNLWSSQRPTPYIASVSTATVLTGYSLWYVFRAIVTLMNPQDATLFSPQPLQQATFLVTISAIVCWTSGFMAIVIQRMQKELSEARIAEHQALETSYQRIQAREQLFRNVFEQSPFGAALIGADMNFLRLNHALRTMLSSDGNDIVGSSLFAVVHPEYHATLQHELARVLAGEASYFSLEQRWNGHDGQPVWVEVFAQSLHNEPITQQSAVLLQVADTTVRKFAEDAIREREVLIQAISDHLPDVVVYQLKRSPDAREQFTYVSASIAEISGFTSQQLYDDASIFGTLQSEEERARYRTALDRSFEMLDVFDFEMRKEMASGRVRWSHIRSRPRRLSDGSTVWDGIEIDITPQKELEAHLHRRIDELLALNRITQILAGWTNLPESLKSVATEVRSLFDAVVVAVWVYEGEHSIRRLISLNSRATDVSEYVIPFASSALTQRLHDQETLLIVEGTDDPLIATEGSPKRVGPPRCVLLVPLVSRGESLGLMRICAREHNRVYSPADVALAQTIAAPLATAIENAGLLNQVEASAVEAERRRLGRELHDSVSQALFAAHRAAEVLPHLWELDPDEGKAGLGEIRRLTQSALTEMRALLLELRPQALNAMPLDDALGYLLQSLAARQKVNIETKIDSIPPLPPDVQFAFYRIAQEALNNVSKHSHARHVEVVLSAQPAAQPAWQGEIVLSISDDGRGFDSAHLPVGRIGLATLKERAREIHANLTVISAPGNGAHVTVVWNGASAQ